MADLEGFGYSGGERVQGTVKKYHKGFLNSKVYSARLIIWRELLAQKSFTFSGKRMTFISRIMIKSSDSNITKTASENQRN